MIKATKLEDLTAEMLNDLNEEFEFEFKTYDEVFGAIKSNGDHDEDTDVNYIYNTYKIKTKNFIFSVTGSEYRKDSSVCDEEMDEGIQIVSKEEIEKQKAEKKAKAIKDSESKWDALINSTTTREELIAEIKKLKFPK